MGIQVAAEVVAELMEARATLAMVRASIDSGAPSVEGNLADVERRVVRAMLVLLHDDARRGAGAAA